MYLKRLEIKGFKSFMEKTVLNLLPFKDGRFSVTGIVGPNGSGKSNISDAIRWVMGEQSYKILRGKKSSDIIFAGSENKGQLSVAEVTMILDNSDKRVLSDYEEIVITRRLFRSGDGEYIINNNPVRLFDIHLLLAQSQFSQHAYTVVGQGMIDRLLMVSPDERKDFLDEASGIKEFKIKQHQADLKLTRARENIAQAEVLSREVEPRLRLLSRQVRKLEKRQELELKLRESQESYYTAIWFDNQTQQSHLTKEIETIQENYRQQFANLQAIQENLAKLAKSESRQQTFDELQNKHQRLVREKNSLERELAVRQGQAQVEYSLAGKQNVSWIKNKLTDLQWKENELQAQINKLEVDEKNLAQQISDYHFKTADKMQQKNQLLLDLSRLEKQVFEERSDQNFRQYSGLTAVEAILDNRSKFGVVYGMLAELAEVDEKYRVALEVAAGSYLSSLVVKDDETAKKAIEFLRFNHLGTATFLLRNKIEAYNVGGEFRDVLNISDVYGLAKDLLSFDEKFENIFSFVFGRTLVIDSIAVAQKIGIGLFKMVTLDGDLVEKSGVMRGGYRHRKNNSLTFAQKISVSKVDLQKTEKNIIQIREEIETLSKQVEDNRLTEAEANKNREAVLAKLELLYNNQQVVRRDSAGLRQDLAITQADNPRQLKEVLLQLNQGNSMLEKQIKEKENKITNLANQLRQFNEQEEAKKRQLFVWQEQMQTAQKQVNEILSQRNDLRVSLARIETRVENLTEEVYAELGESIQNIILRGIPPAKQEDLPECNSKIQKYRYDLSLIGAIDHSVLEEHSQTKERYEFLSNQIDDLQTAIGNLEKMILELDILMKKKSEKAFKEIRQEFKRYIKILFDGGEAEMSEVYGEEGNESFVGKETEEGLEMSLRGRPEGGRGNLVDISKTANGEKNISTKQKVITGIDIMVSPPGKKITNINTLSGGERTLSSIALICAVLSYNPSPFVVLDEVEAALDEANTRRFSKIVLELSQRAQFIIITHNRVTMHSADVLYGVTMGIDGMSKLLSVKLE